MKKVLKSIFSFIGIIYMIVAVFAIVCLLNFNEYGLTELGNKTLIVVSDNEMEPNFYNGDLIVVNKTANQDVKVNDMIFFYEISFGETYVNLANVIDKYDVNEKETTYTVKDNYSFSSEYLIGKVSNSKKYRYIGVVLRVLTSKWGFLFLIILPCLLAFLYEIYAICFEAKVLLQKENE